MSFQPFFNIYEFGKKDADLIYKGLQISWQRCTKGLYDSESAL